MTSVRDIFADVASQPWQPESSRRTNFSASGSATSIDFNPPATLDSLTLSELPDRARRHWTPGRIERLTAGKQLPLDPITHCCFLHAIGLMNDDSSVTSGQVKKYLQINHMISLIAPPFRALARAMPGKTLTLLDAGCGNSYLSLALAFIARAALRTPSSQIHDWQGASFAIQVTGIDTNPKVIEQSATRAALLGIEDVMSFQCCPLSEAALPDRLHAVLALHACDTASDDALALGISRQADVIAVAPCCQAELAQFYKSVPAQAHRDLGLLVNSPNLRREAAATFTDALRLGLLRALGYEATATEFIPSTHTPKNRLLLGERRGRYSQAGLDEYLRFRAATGAPALALERTLREILLDRFPGIELP